MSQVGVHSSVSKTAYQFTTEIFLITESVWCNVVHSGES